MLIELTTSGRNQLKAASRSAISECFIAFPTRSRQRRWLRRSNKYRVDCVRKYESDAKATTPSVEHSDISQYIAASGPTHAVDGWSFLGRAVQSLLRGDVYSAIHFGYYAELRAAMALLATEGIGVFNSRHAVITGIGQTSTLPQCNRAGGGQSRTWAGTHAVVVPVLKYWSTLSRAKALLDQIVRPDGIALSAWLDACGAHARSRAVAHAWLKSWGVDLTQIDHDHDARNLVSYRPSQFRPPSVAVMEQVAIFVRDLWSLFEPMSDYKFPSMETQLLRLALQDCGINNPDAAKIEGLGFSADEAVGRATRLQSLSVAVPLMDAKKVSPIESERRPMQVIARAAMLLFVATRSASIHLGTAGYTRGDLSFWWRRFGVERSLWADDLIPDDPRDAWADIRDALEDLEASISGTVPTSRVSWHRNLRKLNRSAEDFVAWELVAIWGLVP